MQMTRFFSGWLISNKCMIVKSFAFRLLPKWVGPVPFSLKRAEKKQASFSKDWHSDGNFFEETVQESLGYPFFHLEKKITSLPHYIQVGKPGPLWPQSLRVLLRLSVLAGFSHPASFHLSISFFIHSAYFYTLWIHYSYSSFISSVHFITLQSPLTGSASSARLNTVIYIWLFLHCARRRAMCRAILIVTESLWTYLSCSLPSTSAYRATGVLFCDQHCLNFILFTTKLTVVALSLACFYFK